MICLECVNGLRRDMPGKTEVVCCLDSRLVMSVFKCNFFFRAVDERPIVESVMPDLKYEVEDTKRKIMTSHYQEIVGKLKEEQQGMSATEMCEQIEENNRKIIENDIKIEELKRGRGRPRKT